MQLVINTRGAYLKKNKNVFLVKNDDKTFEVSANKVESILIKKSAPITTDAIKFALENNIDIVFLDHFFPKFKIIFYDLTCVFILFRK